MSYCPKHRYRSKAEADRAKNILAANSTRDVVPCRSYHCEECNGWHLTSKVQYRYGKPIATYGIVSVVFAHTELPRYEGDEAEYQTAIDKELYRVDELMRQAKDDETRALIEQRRRDVESLLRSNRTRPVSALQPCA